MSMNAFKPPRPYTHTTNKPRPQKEANFNLATDFPSLSSSSSSSSNAASKPSKIDYSHTFAATDATAMPINFNPREPTIPPPGWHKYTCNKTTHVITAEYGNNCHNMNADLEVKVDLKVDADENKHNFIKMMQRLETSQLHHAEQFIECYGYDCYERTFLMPNFTPHYFSDASDRDSNSNSDNNSDYYSSDDDR